MKHQHVNLQGPTPEGVEGIQRSAQHADEADPGWVDRACQFLRQYAERQGNATFTIDEARPQIVVADPPDLRAWGAVTQRCVREGWIVPVPGVFRRAKSSHGSPKQVYRGPS